MFGIDLFARRDVGMKGVDQDNLLSGFTAEGTIGINERISLSHPVCPQVGPPPGWSDHSAK